MYYELVWKMLMCYKKTTMIIPSFLMGLSNYLTDQEIGDYYSEG